MEKEKLLVMREKLNVEKERLKLDKEKFEVFYLPREQYCELI